VLWWGPDFLSNAGRKNGFDEINYINNLHLWIDVDPRVVNSVLAELWDLKRGKIGPAPVPQPIQNTPDTGAAILVASADGDRWRPVKLPISQDATCRQCWGFEESWRANASSIARNHAFQHIASHN